MPNHPAAPTGATSETSNVWRHHVPVPGTPEGFTCRTTYPTNPEGAEVFLEQWDAGSAEPPHSHPGDDMTVVVAKVEKHSPEWATIRLPGMERIRRSEVAGF